MDRDAVGQARARPRAARRRDRPPPRRAAHVPRLRVRARRARPGRCRTRRPPARDDPGAARGRDDPAAAVRRLLRRPAARDGARARRTRAVHDRGRHPPPARGERRAHRSRDGALRRRPRHPPAGVTRTRTKGSPRAAVDRRRRRLGVGARAHRPLRRGAPLLEARAAARDEGQREVLPPRDDRALPRRRPDAVGAEGGGPQPAASRCSGPRRSSGWCGREAACAPGGCNSLLLAGFGGGGVGAPARQLHRQPVRPGRGRGRPALRPLRGRHGRDPDAPAGADPASAPCT